MAKAKKSESAAKGAEETSAGAPRGKASARRKKPAQSAGGAPWIDTSLAAQNAARMLTAKARMGEDSAESAESEKESASFKQLKESVHRPSGQSAANVLGNALGPSKSNLPAHGGNQVAHNQTFGTSARVNVPRRTNG